MASLLFALRPWYSAVSAEECGGEKERGKQNSSQPSPKETVVESNSSATARRVGRKAYGRKKELPRATVRRTAQNLTSERCWTSISRQRHQIPQKGETWSCRTWGGSQLCVQGLLSEVWMIEAVWASKSPTQDRGCGTYILLNMCLLYRLGWPLNCGWYRVLVH